MECKLLKDLVFFLSLSLSFSFSFSFPFPFPLEPEEWALALLAFLPTLNLEEVVGRIKSKGSLLLEPSKNGENSGDIAGLSLFPVPRTRFLWPFELFCLCDMILKLVKLLPSSSSRAPGSLLLLLTKILGMENFLLSTGIIMTSDARGGLVKRFWEK